MKAVICSQSDFACDYRIHKLRRTLESMGYEVTCLGRKHPQRSNVQDDVVSLLDMWFWHGPLFYAELNIRLFFRILFCRRYDLVVAIDLDTLPGCTMATGLRHEMLLFDSHEYFPGVPEIANKPVVRWVWNRLQDLFVPFADVCVTVCQSLADIFRQKYGKNFLVVRNVPLAERRCQSSSSDEQPSPRPFTILYQGAVNVGRGVEETIRALPSLPDCHFLVVGDGDVMSSVRQLAADCGVADRVEFAGRRPFNELGGFMARADVGIVFMQNLCPNYYYSLPNRIFDFIQAGLPILGVDFPEIARIVRGNDVGICISDPSPDNVRDAVMQIRNNPAMVQRWKDNMARMADSLTWENEVAELRRTLASASL